MKNVKLNIQRFSHTNSTTNYELPQFVGSDKPAWLTDINGAFSTIDTSIKASKDRADSAYTLADTANGNAGTAQTTANSAVTSAGTANTNIGTMANLTTTEKSSLVVAINEVKREADTNKTNINKFNLSVTDTLVSTGSTNIDTLSQSSLNIATNSDGSIFKLYGFIGGTALNTGSSTISYSSTLRPDSEYTISNCIIAYSGGYLNNAEIKVKTTGVIEVGAWLQGGQPFQIVLPACIYFNKDFGDQPI